MYLVAPNRKIWQLDLRRNGLQELVPKVYALDPVLRERCLASVRRGELTLGLHDVRKCCDALSLSLRKWILRQRACARDDKEALPSMWIAEMMRRDQAVAAAADVLGASHLVSEILKCFTNGVPGATVIMPLEIADVFQDHVPRSALLQDGDDLVEQSATRLVPQPFLIARL